MSAVIPATKLAAVNYMLNDLGERPVSTLSGSTRFDVVMAEDTLDEVTREFSERGYWFNTQRVKVTLNGSDQYAIDPSYVHVEVEKGGPTTGQYDETPILVVRDGVLFDTANNTDTFAGAGTITLIVHKLLAYETLPSTARSAIYAAASVRNQERSLGAASVDQGLQRRAGLALARLNEEELDHQNFDLTTSPRFITMMWDS